MPLVSVQFALVVIFLPQLWSILLRSASVLIAIWTVSNSRMLTLNGRSPSSNLYAWNVKSGYCLSARCRLTSSLFNFHVYYHPVLLFLYLFTTMLTAAILSIDLHHPPCTSHSYHLCYSFTMSITKSTLCQFSSTGPGIIFSLSCLVFRHSIIHG